jgi:hypothetical protein
LLPSILRYEDEDAQLNEHSIGNLEWSDYRAKSWNIAQRLVRKLTNELKIDSLKGFKETKSVKELFFPENTHISSQKVAEIEAKIDYSGLII